MLNQPAYFTFLSACLVLLTSWLLALRTHGRHPVFHVLRVGAVVQMIITGVIFNVLLREGSMTGVWFFNDVVLHQLLPVWVPVMWLVFGPFGRITGRVVTGSLLIPVLWLVVTLIRGPALDWYPYTILDVPGMGYDGVGVYVGAVLILHLVLACTLWALDRVLGPGRPRGR